MTGKLTDLDKLLQKYDACSEAREFAREHPTLEAAWAACQRGDWMLWLAAKAGLATRQEIVLTACAIWREITQAHAKDARPLKAIETAEAWARGEATIEQVHAASDAAYAAAAAAYAAASAAYAASDAAAAASDAAYAAAAAASAAASSAYAASDAAYAASDAASDASDAAYAASDAASDASDAAASAAACARSQALARAAEIVRQRIPLKGGLR